MLDLNEPEERITVPQGFLGPHLFSCFAHSGGQSVIHRRIALKRRIDAAAGYRGHSSICYAYQTVAGAYN